MSPKVITYKIEEESVYTEYVIHFIFDTLGFKGRKVDDDQVDLYYGNEPIPRNCKIAIKKNKADLIWQELIKDQVNWQSENQVITFDLINAIGLFLNDEVNKNTSKQDYDKHDLLLFDKSFQYKSNLAKLPVVNLYISFLKTLFEHVFMTPGLPLWPDGKQGVIGLSHDVDTPDRYAILKLPLWNKQLGFKDNLFINLKKIRAISQKLRGRNPHDFWLFKEITDAEEKFGFKSTFFFASMNQSSDWGSHYDVSYNIEEPKFSQVFHDLIKRGFEIGLHASYNAYTDTQRFLTEKQKLAAVSGTEITGLRHHYWHTGEKVEATLAMHEQAGFEYDSSLAFDDALGFRRNVALPYYPWNQADVQSIRVIQLPVFCMDGNIFYHANLNAEAAVDSLKEYISIIKETGGIGVIDWHVRTSYPANQEYRNWGEAYLKILAYLATDPELWVTNLGNIASWLKRREELLLSTSCQ